jgi:hypothetical protein
LGFGPCVLNNVLNNVLNKSFRDDGILHSLNRISDSKKLLEAAGQLDSTSQYKVQFLTQKNARHRQRN